MVPLPDRSKNVPFWRVIVTEVAINFQTFPLPSVAIHNVSGFGFNVFPPKLNVLNVAVCGVRVVLKPVKLPELPDGSTVTS
jgi:hypothetical protein